MPEVTPQQETAKVILRKYIQLANSSPQALSDDQILKGIPELSSLYGSNTSPAIGALRNYDQQLQNTPDDQVASLNQSFISSAGQNFATKQEPQKEVQTSTPVNNTQPQSDPSRTLLKGYIQKRNASPQDLSDDEIKKDLIANGIVTNHDEIIGQLRSYDQELQNTPDDQIGALNQTYLTNIDGVLKKKASPELQAPVIEQGTTSENVQATSLQPSETESLQSPLAGSTLGLEGTGLASQSQIPDQIQPIAETGQQPIGPYKPGFGGVTAAPTGREEGVSDERSQLKKFAPLDSYINDLVPQTKYNQVNDADTRNLLLNIDTGKPFGSSTDDAVSAQRLEAETGSLSEMSRKFDTEARKDAEQTFDSKMASSLGLKPEEIQDKKEEWAFKSKIAGQGEESGMTQEDIAVRDRYANNYVRKNADVVKDEYFDNLSTQLGEKAPDYWKKKGVEIGKSYLSENDLATYSLKQKISTLEGTENRTAEQESELKKLKGNLETLQDEKLAGKDLFNEDGSFKLNKKIEVKDQGKFTDAVNKYAAVYDGTDKATLTKERDNAFFQYVYAKRQYDELAAMPENQAGKGSVKVANSPEVNAARSYMEDRLAYFMGINRALLLNEDPGSIDSDGFFTGIAEGFKQGIGVVSMSESALRDNAIQGIQAAGFEITPDQEAKIGQDFTEKLGRSIGASIPIMAEIGINLLVANKVAGALKIPQLAQTIAKGNKTREFLLNLTYDVATQSIAFQGAGESGFAGAGEGIGQSIGTAILGRFGVTNRFANAAVRLGTGTVTETMAEYAGEFIDEAEKNGWDMQKAAENTFGKTAEEGIEKLALTLSVAAILGGPGAVMGSGNGNQNSFLFATEGMKEVQKSKSDSPIVKNAQENDFTIPPTKEGIAKKEEILQKKAAGETVTEEELNQATLTETREEFQKTKDIPVDAAPVIAKPEGKDTEYTFSEAGETGFVSEKELITKLDDEKFIQSVSEGKIGLNVVNPSSEVESKIKDKFPEKAPEAQPELQPEKPIVEKPKTEKRDVINGKKLPMKVEHNWSSGKDVKVSNSKEALSFADENLESIKNDYLTNHEKGKNGVIDPDAIREYFAETGYNGKNVPDFVAASNKITEAIFQDILKTSKNKKITFLSGVGGSGKTRKRRRSADRAPA